MDATTLLRSSALALAAVVTLTGCVTAPPVSSDYCGAACAQELREQRREALRGRTYNEHHSQEYRDAMAHSRRTAERWSARDHAQRITTAGPELSAYGRPGAAGYMEVAECKRDVMHVIEDWPTRERFLRICYDLLPEQHREAFYLNDKRVRPADPLIIVVPVPVQKP